MHVNRLNTKKQHKRSVETRWASVAENSSGLNLADCLQTGIQPQGGVS